MGWVPDTLTPPSLRSSWCKVSARTLDSAGLLLEAGAPRGLGRGEPACSCFLGSRETLARGTFQSWKVGYPRDMYILTPADTPHTTGE